MKQPHVRRQTMLHIDITLEDTRIIATALLDNSPTEFQGWAMTVTDGPTGKSATGLVSNSELHAIIAIAVEPDGMPIGVKEYYAIAERAIERCKFINELRPIP